MQPMKCPASLQPTTTESMTLWPDRVVAFPKATPTFTLWRGDPVEDNFGGKAILDFDGSPAFAELVILWTLQNESWQGVWVDSFRRAYCTGYRNSPPQKSLSEKPSSLSDGIWNLAKTPSGVWDVFFRQDDRVLFCESKKAGRDRNQECQRRFAETALNLGLPRDSFLFVEWTAD
jgi:hypothetical protein